MGQLLIDVLTLEKEGLVGFTEIGEQVPLKLTRLSYHNITESGKEQMIKDLEGYVHFAEVKGKFSCWVYEKRI